MTHKRFARRAFVAGLMSTAALSCIPLAASAGPRRRRKRRRRRRIRRRAAWRVVNGRRRLIVPVAIAVGWELDYDDRVVVVTEVHREYIVVDNGGVTTRVEILKEGD